VIALDYVIQKQKKDVNRPKEVEARRNELTVIFKNAIMYHLVKNREKRRAPKLKDILMMEIEKKKKEMAAARRKKQKFLLDQLGPSNTYLTDEQYALIKDQIDKINKTIEHHDVQVDGL